MTTTKLILNNLRHYRRSHCALALAIIITTAVIMGGLAIGDSVRFTLKSLVDTHLGKTQFAMILEGRFFTTDLANRLRDDIKQNVAPILHTQGLAINPENQHRINQVNIWATDKNFWQDQHIASDKPHLILNDILAKELNIQIGQQLLIRINKSNLLSGEAPLSQDQTSFALRLPVTHIINENQQGHFSLQANQIAPYNIFVNLQWLQQKLDQPNQCNGLLVGWGSTPRVLLNKKLKTHLTLADAGLELKKLPNKKFYQLTSSRVFLDPPVLQAAQLPNATPIFSYFVNQLQHKNKTTPYSIVSTHPNLADNEILISDWLAQDLNAQPNDTIKLTYYTLGLQRKLIEKTTAFKVKAIFPLADGLADKELMPNFSGLADAENCRNWQPGIPIDLEKIRDKDEAYWDKHRGTPKAFISLNAAQKHWANRFGNLTALRYPTKELSPNIQKNQILQNLDPKALGLFFQPIRLQALAASTQGMDFGGLFLGFSLFLLISALILVTLLFNLSLQQRTGQFTTLQALGFTPKKIKRLFLTESIIITLPAIAIGLILGIAYTRLLILGLLTLWQEAIGSSPIHFHIEPSTAIIAALATFIIIALIMILSLRKKQPKHPKTTSNKFPKILSTTSFIAAGLIIFFARNKQGIEAAGIFFAAGTLLLIATITLSHLFLKKLTTQTDPLSMTLPALAIRNTTRNPSRSLAVIILLACGTFILFAVSANRHDPLANLQQRSSGTGGFALFAESSLPIFQDLNSQQGQNAHSLSPDKIQNIHFTPFRVRAGDDASCLNLNRAQKPELLGIRPQLLHDQKAFTFTTDIEAPWLLLDQPLVKNVIPAIGDKNSVIWALGKNINDVLDYTDEKGNTTQLKIIAMLETSILQGSLIISEKNFIRLFPSQPGHQTFLIDTDFNSVHQTKTYLANALEDVGFNVTLTSHRLLRFNAVQNTYLAIFQLLGGLGLILGTTGFAIILTRNVLERRQEFAICRAIGFSKTQLQKTILLEHTILLTLGLLSGLISAALAITPSLKSAAHQIPWPSILSLIIALTTTAFLCLYFATTLATKAHFLTNLRTE
jgi:putative ABC transport system permease protein